jgi:hypothetical protein
MEPSLSESHGVKRRQSGPFDLYDQIEPQRKKLAIPERAGGANPISSYEPSSIDKSSRSYAQDSVPTEDQLFCFGMVRSNQPSSVISRSNIRTLGNRHKWSLPVQKTSSDPGIQS